MQLASLGFLFLFLPALLLVFYLCPAKWRYLVLLVFSLLFYWFSDPIYLPVLLINVMTDFCLGLLMEFREKRGLPRKVIAVIIVIKDLLMLLGISSYCQLKGMAAPLGLPVYTLLGIGYAVDLYQGEALYEHNAGRFLLSHILFFKLPAGPLVRYRNLTDQFSSMSVPLDTIGDGLALMVQGLAKQTIIGSPLKIMYTQLAAFSDGAHSVFSLWLMPLCAAMNIYFTLSGYCDMARGLGQVFGVRLPRGFYYPYQSRSVTDFVGRFNISVTEYFKTYIYTPLGESSGGAASSTLNIVLITLLWGLWFGFRINYLFWGLFFALVILLERGRWGRILSRIPVFFLRIYTFSIVLFSFVIFAGRTVGQSAYFFTGMLGLRGLPLASLPDLYLFTQFAPYLIFAVVFSTSLPHSLKIAAQKKNPAAWAVFSFVWYVCLLGLSVGFILHPWS